MTSNPSANLFFRFYIQFQTLVLNHFMSKERQVKLISAKIWFFCRIGCFLKNSVFLPKLGSGWFLKAFSRIFQFFSFSTESNININHSWKAWKKILIIELSSLFSTLIFFAVLISRESNRTKYWNEKCWNTSFETNQKVRISHFAGCWNSLFSIIPCFNSISRVSVYSLSLEEDLLTKM